MAIAVGALAAGGIVAYPTEAVYGLGCDPANRDACERLFRIKQRPPGQGVLLIAADPAQLARWADLEALPPAARAAVEATWPGPATWVVPRRDNVPAWVSGTHAGIAVRVTAHPLAAELCRRFGGALVSTSANRHGEAPLRDAAAVRARLGDALDAVLDGALGGLARPTPIRDALSGRILRA
jgi:L-threonylcarbamoyladenylate synthase